MSELPPHGLTAQEAGEKIRQGWLSSVELVTDCLDRIEATDGQIKAWAHIDRDKALARAHEMDAIRQSGRPMGRLHGIPVGLKDIIDTASLPTAYGSPIFDGNQPDADAFVVNRLLQEGAVILGKTISTEFAFVNPSITCNPHNPEHTPGGSSSGSAAAVAGYQVPLAIGSQTNGSVIRPASFCGTYGFKPSHGVISRHGVLKTCESFDQLGVFGRSLEDIAALTDVVGGYDPGDRKSYAYPRPQMLEGTRSDPPVTPNIVWLEMPYADQYSEEVRAGFEEVIEALGGQIERVQPAESFAGLIATHNLVHEYEYVHHLKSIIEDDWDQISPNLQTVITRGQSHSKDAYEHALGVVQQTESFFADFFQDYDAVLTPAAFGEAPLIREGSTGDPSCCTIWTMAGLPSVSLPLLTGNNGLPIGVQLVGARQEDDRLLRTANWLLKELE
ncbi:MAG: amidase [Pseudomonadota bacterium]